MNAVRRCRVVSVLGGPPAPKSASRDLRQKGFPGGVPSAVVGSPAFFADSIHTRPPLRKRPYLSKNYAALFMPCCNSFSSEMNRMQSVCAVQYRSLVLAGKYRSVCTP
jgi:hypothetical protein